MTLGPEPNKGEQVRRRFIPLVQDRPSASEARPAATSPSAETPAPRTPPQLSDVQKTFITAGGKAGSYEFPAISEFQRGTLGVSAQLNEMALSRGRKNVAVSVTTRTSGSWGLSVGWTKTIDPKSSE
ncbi:hypothetical protein GCM10022403_053400 [Streptomyces coacervatus]|uniref:Uncharacterized protein n=1 Tax=Streptomyces coacervatus TaxID=647381 RepID=A0ABP7I9M4_9ACTN